jgi:hypothetical protein
MNNARAWKLFLRAFKLSVGTCLSAASSKSVATWLNPFVRVGAGDEGTMSTGMLPRFILLVWNLRDLANCRLQAPTLKDPSTAQ